MSFWVSFIFFFNDTETTEIYTYGHTLSLPAPLPIFTDPANPRVRNLHGHILKCSEEGDSPLATKFSWEIFLSAGDPSLAAGGSNLVGDIEGEIGRAHV